MTIEELVRKILKNMGGRDNVVTATNCMTRLRINVKNDGAVKEGELKSIEGVMMVVHDRANFWEVVVGPGNAASARMCAGIWAFLPPQGLPRKMTGRPTRPR